MENALKILIIAGIVGGLLLIPLSIVLPAVVANRWLNRGRADVGAMAWRLVKFAFAVAVLIVLWALTSSPSLL